MSNSQAIAAVTRTIANMIGRTSDNVEDVEVTALSPDKAARNAGRRVNLFLYHTMPNVAWRNQDDPTRVKRGERGFPPLALNLHYLVTAYGEDNDDYVAQELLGRVMQRLHDRPVLGKDFIRRMLEGNASGNLADQFEKIRVVPDPLGIEEMSRLWTTFQTQYRVSAAYQAAVVLIDSERPTPSALPVAKRGEQDLGVKALVGIDPVIQSIEYRGDPLMPGMPAATVGSTITITGANFPSTGLSVVIRDPKQPINGGVNDNVIASIQPQNMEPGKRITAKIDETIAIWPAGMLTAELEIKRDGREVYSTAAPLGVAAEIQTSDTQGSAIAFHDESTGRLTVNLKHPLGQNRRVMLILNREAKPNADGSSPPPPKTNAVFQIPQLPDETGLGNLSPAFDVSKVPPGTYWIRIRVDGVDSALMKPVQNPTTKKWMVQFDENQKVTIG